MKGRVRSLAGSAWRSGRGGTTICGQFWDLTPNELNRKLPHAFPVAAEAYRCDADSSCPHCHPRDTAGCKLTSAPADKLEIVGDR